MNHPRIHPGPLLRLGLACVALLMAPNPPAAAGNEAELYENAEQRFADGDYKGAAIQLRNVLKQHPGNLPARILLGRALLPTDRPAAAEKELQNAVQAGADPELVRVPLATAYFEQGKFRELIEKMDPGQERTPADGEILLLRGKALRALGRPDDAASSLARAAGLLPDRAAPQLEQAKLLLARGKRAEAEDLVDIATGLEPENAEAWTLKGDIRLQAGATEQALAAYDEAIRHQPGLSSARIGRAALLVDLNRDAQALEDVRRVLGARPGHPEGNLLAALLAARANDYDGARQYLHTARETVTRIDPAFLKLHSPTLLVAGLIKFASREFTEAENDLRAYLELDRGSVVARKLLGAMLLQRGRADEAAAVIRPALDQAGRDSRLLVLMGRAYQMKKQYLLAVDAFEKAMAQSANTAEILPDLAFSRLANGQVDQAVKDLEAAQAAAPSNPDIPLLLGTVHLKRGNFDRAIAAVEPPRGTALQTAAARNLAGLAYLNKGDAGAAQARFEAALTLNPGFVPARFNLARMALAKSDLALARQQGEVILKDNPKNAPALQLMAELAERDQQFPEAAQLLEKVKSLDPMNIGVQLHLSGLYSRTQRPEDALRVVEALLAKYPSDTSILQAEGRLHAAQGRRDRAAKAFASAAATLASRAETGGDKPEAARHLTEVADWQSRVRDFAGARLSLEQAMALNPEYWPAQAAMALLEAKQGKFEEALSRASAIAAKHPAAPAAAVLHGDLLMRVGRHGEAEKIYATAFAKQPDSTLLHRLYQARRKIRGAGPALDLLERWVDAHPTDRDARRTLAIAHFDAGHRDRAESLLERLPREDPKDAIALNALAWIYQSAGDSRARGLAERACKLSPNDPAMLDTLGWILVRSGEPALGLKHLRQAYALASGEPRIRYHLAVALDQLGRKKEARQQLSEAFALSKDYEDAEEAGKLLKQLTGN